MIPTNHGADARPATSPAPYNWAAAIQEARDLGLTGWAGFLETLRGEMHAPTMALTRNLQFNGHQEKGK